MRSKIWVLLIASAAAACAPSGDARLFAGCFRNSLIEPDLGRGEQILPDSEVVKVTVSDQDGMIVRSGGKQSFPASNEDARRYGLDAKPNHRWLVAMTGGLVARDLETAQRHIYEHVAIDAAYYPATGKLVVFTLVPRTPAAKAFPFWVFVRVPSVTTSVTYDCGTFD